MNNPTCHLINLIAQTVHYLTESTGKESSDWKTFDADDGMYGFNGFLCAVSIQNISNMTSILVILNLELLFLIQEQLLMPRFILKDT